MKKLRLALGLVFALTFSLFLVACGGGNKEVTDIELEGGTRTFTEGQEFTTGDLTVTVYYRGSDEPVVLNAEQYEVDSSAYDPDNAGTYQIIITPEQTPAEGAQPVTQSYEVTVEHNWQDKGDGTYECDCGARRESFTGLTDLVTTTAWGNQATLTNQSAQSPATAPIAGENHVSYGVLVAGQSMTLTLEIVEIDVSSVWNTPLMGIRNGADGTLPREDNWVIATAAGFTSPWGTSSGYSATVGTATADSEEWEVFVRGTSWAAEDMVGGTDTITYDYSIDSIMTIRHNLTKSDGSKVELVYSMKLPDASYEIVAYGEKVTYRVTAIETVMNRYVTGFTAELPDATVQPEGKMFDTTGITTEATMSKGNPVSNSYNAYAYIDVVTDNGDGTTTTTPTRVNLATEALQAGMYAFNVEFAGQVYYFTSDGTMTGTSQIKVVPSSFTAVGASAVSKDGVVFDAPNASFDYAVNDSENGIVIVGTGEATMLTAAQKEALGTSASSFVSFKISSLAEGVTAVSVSDGYAALNGSVIDVVLPLGASYTLTITSGEESQTVTIDLSDVTAPAAGAYVAESDFNLDQGGTYTVVYTGLSDVDSLSLVTGGVRDTVADIKAAIAADEENHRYTALNGFYINSVEETAEGLEVVYEISAPQVVNLSATNAYRAVEVRNADGETLVSLTLRYNMVFSDNPSGSYAKIGDNTVVYVSRDVMYVIKAISAEEVDGNVQYSDLFIDATLNIQNKAGESYDVSVSASASGVAPDASNTITSSVNSTGKVVAIGNIGDTSDYDYGALVVYQFSVKLLGLRTEDNAATYYFTANEDTVNGQDTYTVYTVTGNEITSAEVTPTGERSEMQAFSCVQDGINAYTDENGFVYGSLITPATGEHSWGEEVEGVATCEVCGATKERVTIDENSYYEIVLLSVASSEIIPNTDTADGWEPWVPMGDRAVTGDFAIMYSWTNTRDPYWYQDIVLELTDGTLYFDMNFLLGANAWGELATNVATHTTTVTCNGETATVPAQPTTDSFAGKYTAKMVRLGDTLTVTQVAVLESGDVWEVVDVFTGFTTAVDLTARVTGNPYWVDDLRVTVGGVSTVTTTDLKLGAEDNSTAYTGETPLWTSTLGVGQKVTVSGTATSSGASVWNSPNPYLWTGDTASLNFRPDNYINGTAEDQATVAAMNFTITKVWQGFEPSSVNGADWVGALVNHYNQGAFGCTFVWDYTDESVIVVTVQFVWEDATFNQRYEVRASSGSLLDTYSIGLGVDCAYFNVTQMITE